MSDATDLEAKIQEVQKLSVELDDELRLCPVSLTEFRKLLSVLNDHEKRIKALGG